MSAADADGTRHGRKAVAAQDKTAAKSTTVNCTALGQQVAILEGQVDEWKNTCAEFADQHDVDERLVPSSN
jgi:hypothetical protein